jgi:hypothetical protein
MHIYQFLLPAASNKGVSYGTQRSDWAMRALDMAGGYTIRARVVGSWRSDDGKTYTEAMCPIDVGCSVEVRNALLQEAFRLFPDQLAVSVIHGGELTIETRENKQAEKRPDLAQSVVRRLSAYERTIREAGWRLDAALSARRKDAVGYRTRNAANPDGGANERPGELEAALKEAQRILERLDASSLG